MKTIYSALTGILVGFAVTLLVTPKSGKKNRKNILDYTSKKSDEALIGINKLALKLGIGSRKKVSDLINKRIAKEQEKAEDTEVDPTKRTSNRSLKKKHERDDATKAVDSPTAKSALRDVPINEN